MTKETDSVVSHRETWIEICFQQSLALPRRVVSHRETWIEILKVNPTLKAVVVVSHRETWIEIFLEIPIERQQASSLTERRGLKFCHLSYRIEEYYVVSHRETWIEILRVFKAGPPSKRRLSQRDVD